MDSENFPDVGSMSNEDLRGLIATLREEEGEVSYRRRILHGQIDILRAELVTRLRGQHEAGELAIKGDDVEELSRILSGTAPIEDEANGTSLS